MISTGNFDSSATLSHNTAQSPWQPVVQQWPCLYTLCAYVILHDLDIHIQLMIVVCANGVDTWC